jgi:hypothetical protein
MENEVEKLKAQLAAAREQYADLLAEMRKGSPKPGHPHDVVVPKYPHPAKGGQERKTRFPWSETYLALAPEAESGRQAMLPVVVAEIAAKMLADERDWNSYIDEEITIGDEVEKELNTQTTFVSQHETEQPAAEGTEDAGVCGRTAESQDAEVAPAVGIRWNSPEFWAKCILPLAAMDMDGRVFAYGNEPILRIRGWYPLNPAFEQLHFPITHLPDDWKQSLIERPKPGHPRDVVVPTYPHPQWPRDCWCTGNEDRFSTFKRDDGAFDYWGAGRRTSVWTTTAYTYGDNMHLAAANAAKCDE